MKFKLLLFIVMTFLACDSDLEFQTSAPTSLQSLEVGNQWYYVDSIFGDEIIVENLRISIESKVEMMNFVGDVYDWSVYRNNEFSYKNFVALETENFIHLATIHGVDTLRSKQIWAPYPIDIGDQFQEARFSYLEEENRYEQTDVWTWTCVQTDRILDLEDQEIESVVFETMPVPNQKIKLLYAKGVGYAGWEVYEKGELVFKESLVRFQIN